MASCCQKLWLGYGHADRCTIVVCPRLVVAFSGCAVADMVSPPPAIMVYTIAVVGRDFLYGRLFGALLLIWVVLPILGYRPAAAFEMVAFIHWSAAWLFHNSRIYRN